MKRYYLILLVAFLASCSKADKFGKPNVDVIAIQKDDKEWKKYNKENIELSFDFIPVNSADEKIDKGVFLQELKKGKFIPIKLDAETPTYKLYPIDKSADEKISRSVKGVGKIAYQYFNMEGVTLPNFEFTDLDSITYNNSNMKGNIMVIKCWFISCVPCIQEFPELNEIVEEYKSKKDVKFVSLSFDNSEKLDRFLEKKVFKYATVPEQQDFMMKDLKVKRYPTHLLIDKEGKIYKMVDNVHALKVALKKIS